MMRFEVLRETTDRSGVVEAFTRSVWLDAGDVFAIETDPDPQWAAGWTVLTFKAGTGRRPMTVEGEAAAVAAAVSTERGRHRPPV